MDITIRPMARAERNYCFSWGTHLMAAAGCIGHLCGDMGSEGKSFYTTWFDHQEDLKRTSWTTWSTPSASTRPTAVPWPAGGS